MLISVLGRNRHDFDGLLAFYQMFTTERGLMCWQLIKCGSEVRPADPWPPSPAQITGLSSKANLLLARLPASEGGGLASRVFSGEAHNDLSNEIGAPSVFCTVVRLVEPGHMALPSRSKGVHMDYRRPK